ncbi:hypothetical protein K431DRAFT_157890 [Polychaeton citri CBS 116435]|uniref:Uncharacterized protein n=1 Tax=Polychaeton citri CBS 116435 TaxID=1314669 RepID=A0A9P4Q3K6_9PEZI|nr:hypothetical protein K431DRAFT_157890 [Polychaeton citri CBS 116435]
MSFAWRDVAVVGHRCCAVLCCAVLYRAVGCDAMRCDRIWLGRAPMALPLVVSLIIHLPTRPRDHAITGSSKVGNVNEIMEIWRHVGSCAFSRMRASKR